MTVSWQTAYYLPILEKPENSTRGRNVHWVSQLEDSPSLGMETQYKKYLQRRMSELYIFVKFLLLNLDLAYTGSNFDSTGFCCLSLDLPFCLPGSGEAVSSLLS